MKIKSILPKIKRLNKFDPKTFPNARVGLFKTMVDVKLVINSGKLVTMAKSTPPSNALLSAVFLSSSLIKKLALLVATIVMIASRIYCKISMIIDSGNPVHIDRKTR